MRDTFFFWLSMIWKCFQFKLERKHIGKVPKEKSDNEKSTIHWMHTDNTEKKRHSNGISHFMSSHHTIKKSTHRKRKKIIHGRFAFIWRILDVHFVFCFFLFFYFFIIFGLFMMNRTGDDVFGGETMDEWREIAIMIGIMTKPYWKIYRRVVNVLKGEPNEPWGIS